MFLNVKTGQINEFEISKTGQYGQSVKGN